VCAQLRDVALRIIGTKGLSAVTLERLSDETPLSSAGVQAHYATAASCVCDTYEETALGVYEDFLSAFTVEESWRRALQLGAHRMLRRMSQRPAEARLCFAEILHGDHELRRRRERSRRRLVELFVRELGRRRDDPELFRVQLELLIGASYQAIAAAVAEYGPAALPRLESELVSRAVAFEPVAA
jgi:AcrR family transcriptional regulator